MLKRFPDVVRFFRQDLLCRDWEDQSVDPAILQWNLFLLCLAIFTSSFNIVPGILLPTVLGVMALFVQIIWQINRGKEAIYPVYGVRRLFFLYMVLAWIYAALIGVDVLNPSLYRREFKYFFSYSWFFIFSLLYYPREESSEKILGTLQLAAVFSLVWYVIGLIYPSFLSVFYFVTKTGMWEKLGGDSGETIYSGPFLSHSSAGGFYAVLAVMLASFNTRKPRYIALGLCYLMGCLLVFTASRAWLLAVVGLGVMMILNYGIRHRAFSPVYLAAALGLTVISSFGIFHSSWIHPSKNGVYRTPQIHGPQTHIKEKNEGRIANISIRIKLWNIAIRDFLESPIIGVGLSRFDDNKYVMTQVTPGNPNDFGYISAGSERYLDIPFFHVNVGSFFAHTDQHAHNVYLNILAEGGVLFFALFVAMYVKLIQVIARVGKESKDSLKAELAIGINRSLFIVAMASFFANNLQGIIPMIMVFGLSGFLLAQRQSTCLSG